jgi:hypothetical protein
MLANILCALGDAATWAGDTLVAPIVTGVAIALALRGIAVAGEVRDHDTRAANLDTDLTRWVRDRERQLVRQINRAKGEALEGRLGRAEPPPPPPGMEGTRPGSQLHSGAFLNHIGMLMQQALHEYRDEASRKVRDYRLMAQSEAWFHRALRRRSRITPNSLGLSEHGRETLGSWRKREAPQGGSPYRAFAEVKDDPTATSDAAEIRLLEEPTGLSWGVASEQIRRDAGD